MNIYQLVGYTGTGGRRESGKRKECVQGILVLVCRGLAQGIDRCVPVVGAREDAGTRGYW